jgi:phage terminase small subunit
VALTVIQQAFVEHYLRHFNATRAAREAGYSERTAHAKGYTLRHMPEIEEAIRQRLDATAMGADEVLMRLAEQARNEHGQYIQPDGTVDLERMLRDGKGHLIKGFKESRRGTVLVEFYDAQAALVHMGRHHGLFSDTTEHTGEVVIRVEYGDKRTDGAPAAAASETE